MGDECRDPRESKSRVGPLFKPGQTRDQEDDRTQRLDDPQNNAQLLWITDLREALLRGIGETGVPTIETDWVPPSKQSQIGATFTKIAKPTLQCMFEPLS